MSILLQDIKYGVRLLAKTPGFTMLVSAQLALSLVALVAAGLFLRSMQNAQRIAPGFDADRLAVLTFDAGAQGYNEARARDFWPPGCTV